MLIRKPKTNSELDEVIAVALSELPSLEIGSDEYTKALNQLEKLYTFKKAETPDRISKDTLAGIAGSLAGIIIIVSYEHAHPIASKALSFIPKLK